MVLEDNEIKGANWGIEFTGLDDKQYTVRRNRIWAEACGISVPGKVIRSVLDDNYIELVPGFAFMGVEFADAHIDSSCCGNTIVYAEALATSGRCVQLQQPSVRALVARNTLRGPVGVYIGLGGASTSLRVLENLIDYTCAGIFVQYSSAKIGANTIQRQGSRVESYIRGVAVHALSGGKVDIFGNPVLEAGMDGVVYIEAGSSGAQGTHKVLHNHIDGGASTVAVRCTAATKLSAGHNTHSGTATPYNVTATTFAKWQCYTDDSVAA